MIRTFAYTKNLNLKANNLPKPKQAVQKKVSPPSPGFEIVKSFAFDHIYEKL